MLHMDESGRGIHCVLVLVHLSLHKYGVQYSGEVKIWGSKDQYVGYLQVKTLNNI